ncbi:nucleoside triphosphate pyrophosphohydrolase [candidate division CSSED10-310 bacterium]|uniref:Nucleoside triphosphate pyrophosphohydrolase n=1 Tax=candidate division CSSED10-310 bacterium TaxID=2855610 RepID=A0ABV6YS32_UNCC1
MSETHFQKLVEIMELLRSDKGCPWDREQTSSSIKPYLIEETYEVIDALDKDDPEAVKEELGDLLLQIVFQAQLWTEKGAFTIQDVIDQVSRKIVARHPHVFGEKVVQDSQEVLQNWEHIKLKEKNDSSLLSGIPRNLPALLMGQRVQEKVSRVGFDWDTWPAVWEKINEELQELHTVILQKNQPGIFTEFGDFIFTCVNLARNLKIDAEEAMRAAVDKFMTRFRQMEALNQPSGQQFSNLTLAEMDMLWETIKEQETEHHGD